ncbi:transposase, partial [Bacteroides sp. KG122]
MIDFKFKTLTELIKTFSDEQKCIDFLEQIIWNGNPVSPFDSTSKVYKCKNNRYRCKNTGKYFNIKTGTIFENTKVSLQNWFIAIWMYTSHKGGLSSMELQRELGITQKTAWFMLQR